MPGRTRTQVSTTLEGDFRIRTLDILNNSDDGLTIDQIKQRDMVLSPLTSQKMARVLGYLVEMGFVKKAKSRSTGRMVYKAVSKMEEQGYEVEGED
jgi:hypothetical protein